jgi:hypothetical protein
VICETVFCLPDASLKEGVPSEDPLEMALLPEQLSEAGNTLCAGDWSYTIGRIFTEEDAPRWVLFLAGSQILLLDKHTYVQGRYLVFDLDEAYGRDERSTFEHLAAFLSAETLCPEGESDEVLHDRRFCRKVRFLGQNPKIWCQEFNDLQTPELSKQQRCDRTIPSLYRCATL